jgi:hypothetical protein
MADLERMGTGTSVNGDNSADITQGLGFTLLCNIGG